MQEKIHNVCEVKLIYEPDVSVNLLPKISNSADIYSILYGVWQKDIHYIERFYCLFFNVNNHLLGYKMLGMGSQVSCIFEIKSIYQASILMHASSIAIAHNHPSGNLQPSDRDKLLTLKIKEGLRIFDTQLLDHIILADTKYFSFSDSGLL